MKIYHYGLNYDEDRCRIELALYEALSESDAAYSPEWLYAFLLNRIHLERTWLDQDILVPLNRNGCVSSLYFVQNGAQTYGLFSLRLTLLYALLSFREAFVFVHYKADDIRSPTKQDNDVYRSLKESFGSLSLRLCDFLLIGTNGWYSSRMHGGNDPNCQDDAATTITSKNSDRAA